MSDEIKARLIKYLDKLESGLSTAGEFVADQAPDVVCQWLRWELCFAMFWVILLSAAWPVAIKLVFKQVDLEFSSDTNPDAANCRFVKMMMTILISACIAPPIFINATTAAKISIAPKVFVLQEVARLANGL